jgi:hypothetical protein
MNMGFAGGGGEVEATRDLFKQWIVDDDGYIPIKRQ